MKILLRTLVGLIVLLTLIYFLGPKPSKPQYTIALPTIPTLNNLSQYVASQEAKHKIRPGNEAEIIWADTPKQQTDYAIVYLHGFSASKQEGNPAYLYLAKALHANLYLSRLADHGIDTVAPMQFLSAERLWESAKQAFAIGKKLGKKVILVGTSTGGSLALQLAATYPEVNSLILMSPNIAINDKNAWLLNNPWGLQIARKVVGGVERKVTGQTATYQKYWYTNYRLEALVQLEELIESTMTKSVFEKVKQPVLLLYFYKNERAQDAVVRVDEMLKMFDELGTKPADKQKIAIPKCWSSRHRICNYG